MTLRHLITPQKKGAGMHSVLRSVQKRKKSLRLGEIHVVHREEYAKFDVDSKLEMIRALVPLGLMYVQEILDAEVVELAGIRHARKESSLRGRRHGTAERTFWGQFLWSGRRGAVCLAMKVLFKNLERLPGQLGDNARKQLELHDFREY